MGKLEWPFCQYFGLPTDQERAKLGITDPDVVLGCKDRQGEGPLFFFVPVHGGAVRAGVCPPHARLLEQHHGTGAQPVTTEYATAMGAGYHLRWDGAGKVYPLAEWIAAERENGGKVFRRRIRVVEDWEEVDAP